jgi:hypothetical protein
MGSALVACLVIGVAGTARAATLDFTGTLSLRSAIYLPPFVIPGAGTAQVTDDGSFHLLSLLLPGGIFGPINMSLPLTSGGTAPDSLWLTLTGNLSGSFGGISGGPPGGGSMGLQGIAKLCFFQPGTCNAGIFVPLTPVGGAGFGIGGTRTVTGGIGGVIGLTLQDAPWTIGQPVTTIHTPNSTISTPALPGGFAHGPASFTSSTAQPSGVLQLVTVSKVFTSLTSALPDFPMVGVLTLHFVPEPGTLLLVGSGVVGVAIFGRKKRPKA